MTRTLYAFDSANYALAVRDFYNVAFHQPHPPGYPLYVFFARAIDLAVHDANRALILEGIAWSAVAVGCTIAPRARAVRPRRRSAGGAAAGVHGRLLGLRRSRLSLRGAGGRDGHAGPGWPTSSSPAAHVRSSCAGPGVGDLGRRALGRRGLLRTALAVGAVGRALAAARWRRSAWRRRRRRLGGADGRSSAAAGTSIARRSRRYLQVWSPQSAYVVGDFASGGDTQANYNLNFLINYLRQMLGVGLLLVLYLLGRRFGPARLAADYRSRFLALWIVPPLLVYVFAHLGEPGYVLSLAPQAAILVALAIARSGRRRCARCAEVLRARGWRWLPRGARWLARRPRAARAGDRRLERPGVCARRRAGRLPDLRAHDATTVGAGRLPAPAAGRRRPSCWRTTSCASCSSTYPSTAVELLFSEYVPDFQTAERAPTCHRAPSRSSCWTRRCRSPPGRRPEVVLRSSRA